MLPDFENVDFGALDALLPGDFVIVLDELVQDWDEGYFWELLVGEKITEDGFAVEGRASGGGDEEGAVEVEGEALDVGKFGQVGSHPTGLSGKGRK